MAALFAATYPGADRGTRALGALRARLWAPDYTWAWREQEPRRVDAELEELWGAAERARVVDRSGDEERSRSRSRLDCAQSASPGAVARSLG